MHRRQYIYLKSITHLVVALNFLLTDLAKAEGDLAYKLPPSWTQASSGSKNDPDRARRERPWYKPRFAMGMGVNIPEIIPLDGFAFFGPYAAVRLFFVPTLPFNARVEMPSDTISTKKQVGVANPDFTINLKADYGPQYGFDLLGFPGGGSFFVSGGISHRHMRLQGDAKSPILVCSLIEAAKNPPCGNPLARIETKTELSLSADVQSTALLARLGIGWFWHIGQVGYFLFNAGITRPMSISRQAQVTSSLDTASTIDGDITGALAEIKKEKEKDLSDKALREMRPLDEKLLPVLGLGLGVRL